MKALSGVLWFTILILLMHALRDIYGPLLRRRVVKIVLAPGVVVFLFFKILACTIAGARVREIKPFDDRADLLKYEKPTLGFLGEFLIAVLPLACLLLSFTLLCVLCSVRGMRLQPLPSFPLLWEAPRAFASGSWHFLEGFFLASWKAIGNWRLWILLYGAVNVLLAGAPPLKDLKHVAVALALAALAALAVNALSIEIHSPNFDNIAGRLVGSYLFLFGAAIAWIALSVVTVGAWRLFFQDHSERR